LSAKKLEMAFVPEADPTKYKLVVDAPLDPFLA